MQAGNSNTLKWLQ